MVVALLVVSDDRSRALELAASPASACASGARCIRNASLFTTPSMKADMR